MLPVDSLYLPAFPKPQFKVLQCLKGQLNPTLQIIMPNCRTHLPQLDHSTCQQPVVLPSVQRLLKLIRTLAGSKAHHTAAAAAAAAAAPAPAATAAAAVAAAAAVQWCKVISN
jgi:hypothetical protein